MGFLEGQDGMAGGAIVEIVAVHGRHAGVIPRRGNRSRAGRPLVRSADWA